ncbi:hypothetical protein ACQP3J_33645, partial [Escherichia coli]
MNNLSLLLSDKQTNKNPAIGNYELALGGIEKAMWQNFYTSVKNSVESKKKKRPSLFALCI